MTDVRTVGMLKVNPVERPTINDIVDRLHEIASAKGVNLREPLGLNREMPTSAPGQLKKKIKQWAENYSYSVLSNLLFMTNV